MTVRLEDLFQKKRREVDIALDKTDRIKYHRPRTQVGILFYKGYNKFHDSSRHATPYSVSINREEDPLSCMRRF